MQGIALPPLERRLQSRFMALVHSHLQAAPKLAAGIASLPSAGSAFASTQAAWRFLNNDRVSLAALIEPLRQVGRDRVRDSAADFVLLVHDWCKLSYDHPTRKTDLTQLTHVDDVGYELTTALLVSAENGLPLAPVEMHLRTARGMLSTRTQAPRTRPHLEQILPTMNASQTWGLDRPVVHVIDREADSVDHYRRWDKHGHSFLIRADDRRVKWNGKPWLLSEIGRELRREDKLSHVGDATYQGRAAQLWVAETDVVLHRPAKKNVAGRKYERPGRPLPLRFIKAQVRDLQGRVLATWMLLSNAPAAWAGAEKLARCYYWRWKIESFFKLLKSHGQQLEQWLQETGPAIARRLLIASMACVVVWQLQADDSPRAVELKKILVRLSGRQMKYGTTHTAPALLAGLWALLSTLALLEHHDLDDLKSLAEMIPYFRRE
jgi:hypothetical protein